LYDWTSSSDNRVRYYSGEATYTIRFSLPEKQEGENIVINLGNLTVMANLRDYLDW